MTSFLLQGLLTLTLSSHPAVVPAPCSQARPETPSVVCLENPEHHEDKTHDDKSKDKHDEKHKDGHDKSKDKHEDKSKDKHEDKADHKNPHH